MCVSLSAHNQGEVLNLSCNSTSTNDLHNPSTVPNEKHGIAPFLKCIPGAAAAATAGGSSASGAILAGVGALLGGAAIFSGAKKEPKEGNTGKISARVQVSVEPGPTGEEDCSYFATRQI